MGKLTIEGEDVEDLGLTLVGADADEASDVDDLDVLAVEDLDTVEIVEVAVVPPHLAAVLDDNPAVADDIEEDLLSRLETILSPQSMEPLYESEDAPASTRKNKKTKTEDNDDEDDSLGVVKPRQKDEVHCGRCWILVKATIHKCPVDDDGCPVICARKK